MSRAESKFSGSQSDEPQPPLLARARNGDRDALRTLLEQLQPRMRQFLAARGHPLILARESCSDLVNSVYRECLHDLDHFDFRHEPGFRKWAFQKARSKLIDRLRYWQAEARDPSREDNTAIDAQRAEQLAASQFAIQNEELAALEAAFEHLSADHRRVIEESLFLDRPHAQIAADMGRDPGAIRMLLLRAKARLAVLMQEHLGR